MTQYKALITADWQLCNNLPYAKPASGQVGVTDRLLDQMDVIRQIGDVAIQHKVSDIFFLGDLFERRLLDAITLRYGVEAVLALAKFARVWILPGNHDAYSATGSRFTPEVFSVLGATSVRFLDGTLVVSPQPKIGVDFFSMPWCPLAKAEEQLEAVRARREKGKRNVLLLHHPILDCVDGSWKCDAGLEANAVCEGWDMVLAGHFHERQSFGSCGGFVGASMQHDQRDAGGGPRGVEILTVTPDEMKREFVEIQSPRFYTFDWDEISETGETANPGDYVRVGVASTHAEWAIRFAEADVWAKEQRGHGLHVDIYHKPIQQHEERLHLGDAPTHAQALSEYLEIAETEGLDKARLSEIGAAALKEVDANG